MLVLGWFPRHPFGCAQDVAEALGLPVELVLGIVANLRAAGMIEPAPLGAEPQTGQ
jgi:hypothetical protein